MLPNRRNPFDLPPVDPFIVEPAFAIPATGPACGCSSGPKRPAPGPILLEATTARLTPTADAKGVGEPFTILVIVALSLAVGAGAGALATKALSDSPEEVITEAANAVAEDRAERRAQYEQSTLLHGQFPVPQAYRESPSGASNSPLFRLTPIMPESALAQQRLTAQTGTVLPAPLNTWAPGTYADFLIAVMADLKKLDWYAEEALSWIRNGPRDDHNLNPRATETYTTWTRWVLNNLTSVAAYVGHNVRYRISELDRVLPLIVEELSKHPDEAERKKGFEALLGGIKAEYYTAGLIAGYIDAIHAKLPGSYEELAAWTDVEERFVTDALTVGRQIREAVHEAENTWFNRIKDAAKSALATIGVGAVVAVVAGVAVLWFMKKKDS